jgi:hypothetical protein
MKYMKTITDNIEGDPEIFRNKEWIYTEPDY